MTKTEAERLKRKVEELEYPTLWDEWYFMGATSVHAAKAGWDDLRARVIKLIEEEVK